MKKEIINRKCVSCGKFFTKKIRSKKDFKRELCKTCLSKKTKLEKYGDENYNNRKKFAETNMKRYGNKTPAENEEIKNKIKETNLERYGVTTNLLLDNNLEKTKKTKLEKYGDENYNNLEKAKKTKLEKYGDENYNNLEKIKKTNKKKYGEEFYFNTKVFKNEYRKSILEKYGEVHFSKTEEFKKKFEETSIKKFGETHPMKNHLVKRKVFNGLKKTVYERTLLFLEENDIEPLFYIDDYNGVSASKKLNFKCKKCKTVFSDHLAYKNRRIPRCPFCFPFNRSKGEIELANFIKDFFFVLENNREIIKPYEIDIVIPDLKLGVEYNGEYWHSEEKVGRDYHVNKINLMNKKGYDLIFVWEEQWKKKKQEVKNDLRKMFLNYKEK